MTTTRISDLLDPIIFDPAKTPPSQMFDCLKPYTRAEYAERIGAKLCPTCDAIKPLDDFHVGAGTAGRTTYCRDCRNAYYRNRYQRKEAVA